MKREYPAAGGPDESGKVGPNEMKNPGENPIRTTWKAIGDLVKWWLVIVATWGVGIWFGLWIGSGCIPNWWWILYGPCVSLVAWLVHPVVALGLGTTAVAYYLPMKIESRGLSIGAVIVNTVVWTALGASASWSW